MHTNTERRVIGWDIGGAHLKYAVVEDQQLVSVEVLPTPVWKDPHCIAQTMRQVVEQWPGGVRHAVTMTAELTDAFNSRDEGVRFILDAVQTTLGESVDTVFLTDAACLVDAAHARENPHRIASANWQALPALLAGRVAQGLIIDVGSTTTDLIPFAQGRALYTGIDDLKRLELRLLVYTGIARTPVCALANEVDFNGSSHGIAAELFATTADVYRLLGLLPTNADLLPSADGKDKTVAASTQRLARMLCTDVSATDKDGWHALASEFARLQRVQLRHATDHVFRSLTLDAAPTIVGVGIGRFVVARIARDMNIAYLDGGELMSDAADTKAAAADHAPAAALALLAASNHVQTADTQFCQTDVT